ncbi:hypothetical protein FB45DRAFT_1035791 [Roridomyces roridus]|uniref:Uncharacterized protein n=1 Tax=Roridomyces roridus TaxID=1738132 RepID=A0AAD7BA77_9AGAR|nr:hypothetical protein FB45DRAFT_1035791 [Roridomyces roridus]
MFSKLIALFALLAASNAAVLSNSPPPPKCTATLTYIAIGGALVVKDLEVAPGQCVSFADVFQFQSLTLVTCTNGLAAVRYFNAAQFQAGGCSGEGSLSITGAVALVIAVTNPQ